MRRHAVVQHIEKNKFYKVDFLCDCGGSHSQWSAVIKVNDINLTSPAHGEAEVVSSSEDLIQPGFKFPFYEHDGEFSYGPHHDPLVFSAVSQPEEHHQPLPEAPRMASKNIDLSYDHLLAKYSSQIDKKCSSCGGHLDQITWPDPGWECSKCGAVYEDGQSSHEPAEQKEPPHRQELQRMMSVGAVEGELPEDPFAPKAPPKPKPTPYRSGNEPRPFVQNPGNAPRPLGWEDEDWESKFKDSSKEAYESDSDTNQDDFDYNANDGQASKMMPLDDMHVASDGEEMGVEPMMRDQAIGNDENADGVYPRASKHSRRIKRSALPRPEYENPFGTHQKDRAKENNETAREQAIRGFGMEDEIDKALKDNEHVMHGGEDPDPFGDDYWKNQSSPSGHNPFASKKKDIISKEAIGILEGEEPKDVPVWDDPNYSHLIQHGISPKWLSQLTPSAAADLHKAYHERGDAGHDHPDLFELAAPLSQPQYAAPANFNGPGLKHKKKEHESRKIKRGSEKSKRIVEKNPYEKEHRSEDPEVLEHYRLLPEKDSLLEERHPREKTWKEHSFLPHERGERLDPNKKYRSPSISNSAAQNFNVTPESLFTPRTDAPNIKPTDANANDIVGHDSVAAYKQAADEYPMPEDQYDLHMIRDHGFDPKDWAEFRQDTYHAFRDPDWEKEVGFPKAYQGHAAQLHENDHEVSRQRREKGDKTVEERPPHAFEEEHNVDDQGSSPKAQGWQGADWEDKFKNSSKLAAPHQMLYCPECTNDVDMDDQDNIGFDDDYVPGDICPICQHGVLEQPSNDKSHVAKSILEGPEPDFGGKMNDWEWDYHNPMMMDMDMPNPESLGYWRHMPEEENKKESMASFFGDEDNDDDKMHKFMMANINSLIATGNPNGVGMNPDDPDGLGSPNSMLNTTSMGPQYSLGTQPDKMDYMEDESPASILSSKASYNIDDEEDSPASLFDFI